MQKKIDEVNALIAAAIDTDGDPLGVIDTSGTWQMYMYFKPVIYKNGFVYTEYTEDGERLPKKERYKPSDSYDAYQWLSQIATWYRRAMKKAGVALPATGVSTALDNLIGDKNSGLEKGKIYTIPSGDNGGKTSPPLT